MGIISFGWTEHWLIGTRTEVEYVSVTLEYCIRHWECTALLGASVVVLCRGELVLYNAGLYLRGNVKIAQLSLSDEMPILKCWLHLMFPLKYWWGSNISGIAYPLIIWKVITDTKKVVDGYKEVQPHHSSAETITLAPCGEENWLQSTAPCK